MKHDCIIHNKRVRALVKTSYSAGDLEPVERFFSEHGTLSIESNSNHLYPAVGTVPGFDPTGYRRTWLRDTVMVLNYEMEKKNYDMVARGLRSMERFLETQVPRFNSIISGETDKHVPMKRPHVRMNGETMEELTEQWSHAQNDALGYVLWLAFTMALMGKYEIPEESRYLYSLFPRYFEAIEYWHDRDSGHWEEELKLRISSVGVVSAGLTAMRKYLLRERVTPAMGSIFPDLDFCDVLISRGRMTLDRALPHDSPLTGKTDAALLFLVYPLGAVPTIHEESIVSTVIGELAGEIGIRRYMGDSYWCPGYKSIYEHLEREADYSRRIEERNRHLVPGKEAQWCIFDPVLSIIYGKRFLATGNPEFRERQMYYFNRSLGQLTPEDFPRGGGLCPEAWYVEEPGGEEYVPNDNTPLLWAKANLGTAFEYLKRTLL